MPVDDAQVRQVVGIVGRLVKFGHGSPEGVVAADEGAQYHDLDGGAGCFHVKESGGSGPTGWVSK